MHETEPFVQSDACRVLAIDRADQDVQLLYARPSNQFAEQRRAQPAAAPIAMHVHRMFDAVLVSGERAKRAIARKAK